MAKLKGYSGIRPGVTQDLTPDFYEDMPEAERPVFTVSFMTVTEQQEFYEEFAKKDDDGKMKLKATAASMKKGIIPHLKGVKNWPEPMPADGQVSDALYESFDHSIRSFLLNKIIDGGKPDGDADAVKS